MDSLGDFFPAKERQASAQRALKPGTVIRAFVNDTKPPKVKRFVIVAENTNKCLIACVYINSDINPNLFPTAALTDLHIPINADSSRAFIENDSYIDCSYLSEKNKSDLEKLLTDNPDYVIGELSSTEFHGVVQKVKTNRLTLSRKIKSEYGLN